MPTSRQGEQDTGRGARQRQLSGRPWPVATTPSFTMVALGLFVMMAIVALFYQLHNELGMLESKLASVSGGERLEAMSQQMDGLRNRLHGLMADSVEIRLKGLERNLSSGRVTADDLQLFDVLQADIKALEAYSNQPGSPGLNDEVREHPRYQAAVAAAAGSDVLLTKADMLKEISRLRTLLYLCLTGFVASGGIFVGRYWLGGRRPTALPPPKLPRPPLLTRRRSG